MNIGFDAKRAYHNNTGLGHYSRNLLTALSEYYPQHKYYLFNPEASNLFGPVNENMYEVQPVSFFDKMFTSAWRSSWVTKDLKKLKIDLYHGLSHEIPIGIQKTGIKSVVTIHDLIHERFPEQYTYADAAIYRKKFRNACNHADKIIAISEQTKKDIIEFYGVTENKINVCYQSCNPAFAEKVNEEERIRVKEGYGLPEQFFLYVGSVIERKNLLNICKALNLLKNELNIPLVVIGDGGSYKKKVKEYIRQNGLTNKVIFLSENEQTTSFTYRWRLLEYEEGIFRYDSKEQTTKEDEDALLESSMKLDLIKNSSADFPAIYQSAVAMIYPSFFEGFGIPVLEALWSKLPVITSKVSCLPEAGGDGAYYVNPESAGEIAAGMKKIYSDKDFANTMKEKGWQHAQNFTAQKHAESVMNVYKNIL
ncbi:MAG: glycosyltransferase family 4 protein [Chitinophagaceae bacterium]